MRLFLREPRDAGKISGGLFAISSLGNIVGIIVTTFFLIPTIGTRAITARLRDVPAGVGVVSLVVRAAARGELTAAKSARLEIGATGAS